MERICVKCNLSKDLETGFYRHQKDSKWFYKVCKKCRNDGTYQKTGRIAPTAFDKLPDDMKSDIKKMVNENCLLKEISDKHNIKFDKVAYWRRRKYI